MTEPRVLRPSRKRNLVRLLLCLWLGAFTVGGLFWGAWPLALVLGAFVVWQLSMAWLIAFHERSYELHLDRRGFRVHDIFGRVAHDVRWTEVVQFVPVNVNAYSLVVIAWICSPRRPKEGRLRWRRGTADDDGCMPDTYGMPAEELITLLYECAAAGPQPRMTQDHSSLQAF